MDISQRRTILLVVTIGMLTIALLSEFLRRQDTQDDFQLAAAEEALTASKYDDKLLELEKQAIDNAYRQKAEDLIRVWHLDETGQPGRFLTGVRAARKRYIEMMNAIEKRETDLKKLRELSPSR